jgi:Ca2+-binding RTX toxin-like protein
VIDKDGGFTDYQIVVVVNNVAPTALLGFTGPAIAGRPVPVSLTQAFDPSTPDQAAGFRYSFALSPGSLALTYAAASVVNSTAFSFPAAGDYVIYGRIFDKDDGFTTYAITVPVAANPFDLAPLVASRTAAVRYQTLTFGSTLLNAVNGQTYEASWDFGDGTSQPFSPFSGTDLVINKTFTVAGTFTVTLQVKDSTGLIRAVSTQVTIQAAALQADPLNPGNTMLVIGGTAGADVITVSPASGGKLTAIVNGTTVITAALTSRIVIYAGDGDDDITVAGSINYSAWIYCGAGDDRAKGGAGDDVIFGEEGDDLLVGGSGRDLLIGGRGKDRIVGNADDDILIAGYTDFDTVDSAIAAIMAEWKSSRSYAQRVANLRGVGTGQRANGSIFLITDGPSANVWDDGVEDLLTGSSGLDWFLFNVDGEDEAKRDKATDLSAQEFASDLDFINDEG